MISLKRRQQRFNAGADANAGLSDSSILNGQEILVSRINEVRSMNDKQSFPN